MADSPDSPLSSLASDDFADDMKLDEPAPVHAPLPTTTTPRGRATKRRRTQHWDDHLRAPSPASSISSDTSSELPTTPEALALIGGTVEDDYSGYARDQVTACQWDGCFVGDMGDMDTLVRHIHEAHIGPKHRRYLCEWMNCPRKGQTHASGYALRAHIRSHTKEKPFYCTLPECDRSFTRSDALTKHMRTVHENEAFRPFEGMSLNNNNNPNQPASATTTNTNTNTKGVRIKLKLTQPTNPENGQRSASATPAAAGETNGADGGYDPDLGFDEREARLPPEYLCRLLRRQIAWAEQEGEELRQNSLLIERMRVESWKEKEELLGDLVRLEGELGVARGGGVDGKQTAAAGEGRFDGEDGDAGENMAVDTRETTRERDNSS